MSRQLEFWGAAESEETTPAKSTASIDDQALALHADIHRLLRTSDNFLALSELQQQLGQACSTRGHDPLTNPVNRILKWMRDAGEVVAHEFDRGEPAFSLRLYSLQSPPGRQEVAAADCARDSLGEGMESLAQQPTPPLVRPDRQQTFGGKPHYEWPKPIHDRDTITVDRIKADIDGPSHRFTIKRGDYVEVFFSSSKVDYGEVVGISLARNEVAVSFSEGSEGVWFYVGCIYPAIEPQKPRHNTRPLAQIIEDVNAVNAPDDGFSDADQVSFEPYSLAALRSHLERLEQGSVTLSEHKQELRRAMATKEQFIAALLRDNDAKQLKALALRCGNWSASRNTKPENATAVYRAVLRQFSLGDTFVYQPTQETLEQAVERQVNELTEEQWTEHWQQKADAEKQQEGAIRDPQTIADFRLLMRKKGDDALSDAQRVRFDQLLADESREARAARKSSDTVTQIEAEEVAGLQLTIKQGWHDKKKCDLWIVQLPDRVSREAYRELLNKAKMLGGWYSSFRKADAGFQFTEQDQAQRFIELQQGDVDRSDVLEDRKARKMQSASERLASVAKSLEEAAEDTLKSDEIRLKNTARRAEQAAGMRGYAYAQQAAASTLRSIAAKLETGEAKYLDGLRAYTQLQVLQTVLNLAKYRRNETLLKEKGKQSPYEDYATREELHNRSLEPADIAFAEYRWPHLYKGDFERVLDQARNRTGLKQRTRRMETFVAGQDTFLAIADENDIELLQTYLQTCRSKGIDTTWVDRGFEDCKRLRAANIYTPQELRCALRELIPHLQRSREDDPVERLKMELIGKQLPGFFPTPRPVIERMIELADIEPGQRVLEPSAGIGDIIDALKEQGNDLQIHAIEMNGSLHEILAAKGHDVEQGDFLVHRGEYDRIVMNPPFANAQDIDHVRHAHEQLAQGGRLIAVMSEGPFFRQDKKATEFREWLDELGAETEQLPEDAFKGVDAFRQTGVRTRLVTIDAP